MAGFATMLGCAAGATSPFPFPFLTLFARSHGTTTLCSTHRKQGTLLLLLVQFVILRILRTLSLLLLLKAPPLGTDSWPR